MADKRVVIDNRKARHDYSVEETYEAGIVLVGTEVKSLRAGKANLRDSFARIDKGEAWIHNMHISHYEQGNINNHDPTRHRKLLLHKAELNKLIGKVQQKGLTLVPLKVYFKRGNAKLLLALAKGKKTFDKRRDLADKDAKREIAKAFKEKQKMI